MVERYVHEHSWTDRQLKDTLSFKRRRLAEVREQGDDLVKGIARIEDEVAHRSLAAAEGRETTSAAAA